MGRLIRKGVFFTLLLCCCTPASADPLLMFLLGIAKNMVVDYAASRPVVPVEPPQRYPGTTVEPEQLRRLIDESFFYLGDSQRREIFDALNAALMDPKNAAVRGPMIDYFAERALEVRAAQIRLAQLGDQEKQSLAEEFRKGITSLSPEEQAQLGRLLREHLLPVPGDLNQLLLAAFDSK